ncbi:phenylalanine--tRNA ligase beta subunit-related protein [Alkalihalobacillus sp. LMS39]|uniref:B3/B4 domain-containing protein n=1 Tax=Alkalihalobacillus sp. LMS39 TaxID=2924032 RepID=UPI001FB40C46|nr:phenylalanine--tRNA ligase beta subunit-related protein [Alkalihalobacillus sp. LMS39]UOE95351.1 hypothetical protein MM271_06955 [Alkalihalobacillus sp. LMS39]
MNDISICPILKNILPSFQVGLIQYKEITVSESPQMLKGRLRFYQEELEISLENEDISIIKTISEWRNILKTLGVDRSKYRVSSEALLRRIKKGQFFNPINSAVDVNNLLSVQYRLPFGIYDTQQLEQPFQIRLGTENESYIGINGRENNCHNKIVISDSKGPFGSPIVDSNRSIVTEQTENAIQVVYLTPMFDSAGELLASVAKMFTDIHGGSAEIKII